MRYELRSSEDRQAVPLDPVGDHWYFIRQPHVAWEAAGARAFMCHEKRVNARNLNRRPAIDRVYYCAAKVGAVVSDESDSYR